MFLSQGKEGDILVLKDFNGCDNLALRLTAMGLYKGSQLTVVHNTGQGPMVISVFDSRLALGRSIADKLTVNPFIKS